MMLVTTNVCIVCQQQQEYLSVMSFSWTVTRICCLRSGLDPRGVHENVSSGRYVWSGVHLPHRSNKTWWPMNCLIWRKGIWAEQGVPELWGNWFIKQEDTSGWWFKFSQSSQFIFLLIGSPSFMTQLGVKWVVLTHGLMGWDDPISCRVWDTTYPVSASWRSSLRDMPLVNSVSML